MAQRRIAVHGQDWTVAPAGRATQYGRDEFAVVFTAAEGGAQRVSRYSPRATRIREFSLAQLTEDELTELFARSQPAWTSPDVGYAR